mgnify:CR=1 FL=1
MAWRNLTGDESRVDAVAVFQDFEEIAFLLIHGKLPNPVELAAYKRRLQGLRGLSARLRAVLELLPASTHPMDVLRTGVSEVGCESPEDSAHPESGAKDIADRLVASTGSMLCYWHHFANSGQRIEIETDDDSTGGHFLHMLHGKPPRASCVRS